MIFCSASVCTTKKSVVDNNSISIAFYNIDNLFDDINDSDHDDDDFTENGIYRWTKKRYQNKLKNMEKVIYQMVDGNLPDVLGVCELESKKALEDLIKTGKMKNKYSFSHFDSKDERGIDVALIYNKEKFSLIENRSLTVKLSKDSFDNTRDVLFVKLYSKIAKDTVLFLVAHFPSRREGKYQSEQNRIDAAKAIKKFMALNVNTNKQNLILMGDFNDEPWDKSIYRIIGAQNYLKTKDSGLLILMWGFEKQKKGSYRFKNEMNILDQIIISKSLANGLGLDYVDNSVSIFDVEWLKQKGKFEGFPLRTFAGKNWLNGYSDRFAVYIKLKY